MGTVEIFEGDKELQIRVNGVLMYNYHDAGYGMMYGEVGDLIAYVLRSDYQLLEMFVQQLREQGYFSARYPHET